MEKSGASRGYVLTKMSKPPRDLSPGASQGGIGSGVGHDSPGRLRKGSEGART